MYVTFWIKQITACEMSIHAKFGRLITKSVKIEINVNIQVSGTHYDAMLGYLGAYSYSTSPT